MTLNIDPENNEIRTLKKVAGSFKQQSVLEVGCGDGRLTYRYATRAWRVTAIDPDKEKIARARVSLPPALQGKIDFQAAGLEDFARQNGTGRYDRALLAWSL
jgi:2-polyprenyl-3-methyl-5-hydroxy-6-metoxy-1,4-benzoquinol methylase